MLDLAAPSRGLMRDLHRARRREVEMFSRLRHPCEWLARKNARYDVDALTERYQSALRAMRDGSSLSAAIGGIGSYTPHPLSPVGIAKADGFTAGSYYCGDLGVALASGVVATWNDQWGTNHFSQATAGARPANPVESTLGRRSSITGDGTDDCMFGGPDPPPPGTTDYTMRLVARCNTFVADGRLIGGTIRGGTTSDTVLAFNGGANLTGELTCATGTWYRMRLYSSNSAADKFRVGSAQDTTNLANGDRTALPIFSTASSANIGSFSLQSLLYALDADLTTNADALLDAFYRAYLGASVTVG